MDNNTTEPLKIENAIEAILYAAGYPVKYEKIAEVLGLSAREIRLMVEFMATSYNSEESKRGISLLCFDDSAQLCTKEEYAPYIREALGIKRGGNLSSASMEVLAIIAYNQPVTRSYIDAVRGVDSNYTVNTLVDRLLIENTGRLDAPGRPMLYGTTKKFLRVFGISSLDELPKTEPIGTPQDYSESESDTDNELE